MGFYLADFEKTSCCAKVFIIVGEKLLRSVKKLQNDYYFLNICVCVTHTHFGQKIFIEVTYLDETARSETTATAV